MSPSLRVRWITLLAVPAAGCLVPALETPAGDSADSAVADTPADSGEVTDTPADTPTQDTDTTPVDETGWADDTDPSGGSSGGGGGTTLPPLGCHPFFPVDASGWTLKYDVVFQQANNGTETWQGQGLQPLPAWMTSSAGTDAFAWSVVVTGAGDANYEGMQYARCDVGGAAGIYELGWSKAIMTGLLGRTRIDLRADARNERKMLDSEASMLSGFPQWTQNMRFDLTQQGGTLPGGGQAELVHDVNVIGFGPETVTVPAGTFTDAVRVNFIYTEEKVDQFSVQGLFFSLFEPLFAQLFGFGSGTSSVAASSQRWYVRGVGLVKEETVDFNSGAPIVTRELKTCTNLPGCP